MSKNIRTIRLDRLQGRLGDVAYQLTRIHFSSLRPPPVWEPAVNAYRCETCLRICVDLAGIDRTDLELEFEPGRLTLRGQRALPEPSDSEGRPMQVLLMEIDHGRFERQVPLPACVDAARVEIKQCNGLLWIALPLLPHA
jgi:HSP20 family protein